MRKTLLILSIASVVFSGCFGGKGGNRGSSSTVPIDADNSSKTESEDSRTASVQSIQTIDNEHLVVNVYLENSGSMNGYVDNGKTEFQQAVFNYLTDLNISGIPSELNLNYINSQIIHKGSLIDDFINKLSPSSFSNSAGNKATTDISEIFKTILSKTDPNTVSIFISDCIFSPGRNNNPKPYLVNQQIGIKQSVADYLAEHGSLAISVYQIYSQFNGKYFDYNNAPRQYHGMRPFYIWVIGSPEHILRIRNAVPKEKFQGEVAHDWSIYNTPVDVKYSILPNPKKGSFNKDGANGISKIQKDSNGEFMFTIGADLTMLQVMLGDEYLMDTDNYARLVNKETSHDYYVNVQHNQAQNSPATHNIEISTEALPLKGYFILQLCCNTPKWAHELTDDDDSYFNGDNDKKTYGLEYIFNGIQQAFTANDSNPYTKMIINIK